MEGKECKLGVLASDLADLVERADLALFIDREVGEVMGLLPLLPLASEPPLREAKGILMLKPFFLSFADLGVVASRIGPVALRAGLRAGAGEEVFSLSSSGLTVGRPFGARPLLKYELDGLSSVPGGEMALSLPSLLPPGLVGLTGLKDWCASCVAAVEIVRAATGLMPDIADTFESRLSFHLLLRAET